MLTEKRNCTIKLFPKFFWFFFIVNLIECMKSLADLPGTLRWLSLAGGLLGDCHLPWYFELTVTCIGSLGDCHLLLADYTHTPLPFFRICDTLSDTKINKYVVGHAVLVSIAFNQIVLQLLKVARLCLSHFANISVYSAFIQHFHKGERIAEVNKWLTDTHIQ